LEQKRQRDELLFDRLLFKELLIDEENSSSEEDEKERLFSSSNEDKNSSAQFQRPQKRFKQSSETNVLVMMQHLTRRRNELKIIDERLMNLMSSCLSKLDEKTNSNELGSAESEKSCVHSGRVSVARDEAEAQQKEEQEQDKSARVALDLSMSCKRGRPETRSAGRTNSPPAAWTLARRDDRPRHLKKVRLLGAIGQDRAEVDNCSSGVGVEPESGRSRVETTGPPMDWRRVEMAADLLRCPAGDEQQALAIGGQPQTEQPPERVAEFSFASSGAPTQLETSCFYAQHAQVFSGALDLGGQQQLAGRMSSGQVGAEQWNVDHAGEDYERRLMRTTLTNGTLRSTASQLDFLMQRKQSPLVQWESGPNLALQTEASQHVVAADLILPIVQRMSSFRCHVCHSCFEDRHRLQQHLSIHLNLHPSWFEEKTIKETMAQYELRRGDYLCQICQLRHETTADFDRHMQLHGEKPHRCELCQQANNKLVSFRYFRQLLTHLRSHCFLYSCKFAPECKQTANRKDYLKLHILKHHLNNKLPEQFTICCH